MNWEFRAWISKARTTASMFLPLTPSTTSRRSALMDRTESAWTTSSQTKLAGVTVARGRKRLVSADGQDRQIGLLPGGRVVIFKSDNREEKLPLPAFACLKNSTLIRPV